MGVLEYVFVTPSHHRVHHAINSEYLDKNYGQILIIWDKFFNTFQVELDDVQPVYGTLRPSLTWNPILINFKHIWQLIKDAWHAKKIIDKLKIWFMPTGWRPNDVKNKFPIKEVVDPNSQTKYKTNNSSTFIAWTWIQHIIAGIMMFHLFTVMNIKTPSLMDYLYGLFLFIHIFSFTALLDHKKYSILVELFKMVFGLMLIYKQGNIWFNLSGIFVSCIMLYFVLSFLLALNFHFKHKALSV
jgi:hypothetical protein